MNLYNHLLTYRDSGMYPMHMPGHKRNPEFQMENPYSFDVTEVVGTDNLHHPEEVLLDLMNQMREYYGTKKSYPLVNGSTCGILAAISACCKRGDTIVVDRNCHRSVYHGIYLLDLKPVYLYRPIDSELGIALELSASHIKETLEENPEAVCVILTSPTYEGIVSDIHKIADIVHKKNIPLIVDEAHGAHLRGMRVVCDAFLPAMSLGADLVVESLHKTLPALTQTGVLHLCSERVDSEKVERHLAIYETSSPSYVLMASMAQCMEWLMNEENIENKGNMGAERQSVFLTYVRRLEWFYEQAKVWKILYLWKNKRKEPSKLVIGLHRESGVQLEDILRRKYQIETEMTANNYVLAMTSPCDSQEGFERLARALGEIDRELTRESDIAVSETGGLSEGCCGVEKTESPAIVRMGAYEAMNRMRQQVVLGDSVGEIAAEYVMVYPPGIPIAVPGEEITKEVVEQIQRAKEGGLELLGMRGDRIRVVEN